MSTAVISDCGRYRYLLTRGDGSLLPFIMLNPSTADAQLDDPTIRRCRSFATREGYDGIEVVNLYAWRATDPSDLWRAPDPVGPLNDVWIVNQAHRADEVICAWGANARPDRVAAVVGMLRSAGARLMCLGTTANGSPRHPLYVRGDTALSEYSYIPTAF